jgi:hypothetical protein
VVERANDGAVALGKRALEDGALHAGDAGPEPDEAAAGPETGEHEKETKCFGSKRLNDKY